MVAGEPVTGDHVPGLIDRGHDGLGMADPGAGQVSRIASGMGAKAALVRWATSRVAMTSLAIADMRMWTGIRRYSRNRQREHGNQGFLVSTSMVTTSPHVDLDLHGPFRHIKSLLPNETWYHLRARMMATTECLVTMTMRVPEATPGKACPAGSRGRRGVTASHQQDRRHLPAFAPGPGTS